MNEWNAYRVWLHEIEEFTPNRGYVVPNVSIRANLIICLTRDGLFA